MRRNPLVVRADGRKPAPHAPEAALGSPSLEPLLAEAERDERQHLRGYAERVRRGEVDP
ncbi:hypothetical protein [Sorangium sp. So ce131]|uniref:hypothetical protein n=1 Tax=Sorangium sp. So ce131 TaxID=3133282 RepID=UPI003F5E209A